MGQEFILFASRLAYLSFSYVAFTYVVENSKRPIRKIVESSSIDPIGELLSLLSSLWKDTCTAAPSSAPKQANPAPSNTPRIGTADSKAGWGFMHGRTRSVDTAVKKQNIQPLAKLAVEDLCESCRNAWVMAENLNTSFQHFSGVNATYLQQILAALVRCSLRQSRFGLGVTLEHFNRLNMERHSSPPMVVFNIAAVTAFLEIAAVALFVSRCSSGLGST